jgi:hypothetical protein
MASRIFLGILFQMIIRIKGEQIAWQIELLEVLAQPQPPPVMGDVAKNKIPTDDTVVPAVAAIHRRPIGL